jgi:tRNA-binding protein
MQNPQHQTITYDNFQKLDIRLGHIVLAEDFPEARNPAYKLTIDFGPELGIKRSSAQITQHYSKAELLNTLVLAVTNFPPKQIGPFMSEVLTLGFADEDGNVVLATADKAAPLGSRLF